MTCAYCKNITVCAICGKGIGEADATDMRSAFEAWARDEGFALNRLDMFDGASYRDLRTQGPWDAWQACWKQRAPGVKGDDRG